MQLSTHGIARLRFPVVAQVDFETSVMHGLQSVISVISEVSTCLAQCALLSSRFSYPELTVGCEALFTVPASATLNENKHTAYD